MVVVGVEVEVEVVVEVVVGVEVGVEVEVVVGVEVEVTVSSAVPVRGCRFRSRTDMNAHQELAIQALQNMRGDDYSRAQRAFRDMTDEQMQQQHGESGRTRAEVLAGYEAEFRKVSAAIQWVISQKP